MLVLVGESIFDNNIRFLCFVPLEPDVECFYNFYNTLLRVSQKIIKKVTGAEPLCLLLNSRCCQLKFM